MNLFFFLFYQIIQMNFEILESCVHDINGYTNIVHIHFDR